MTRARVLGAILAKALATLENGFHGAGGGRRGRWVVLVEGWLDRSEVGRLRGGRVEGGRGRGEQKRKALVEMVTIEQAMVVCEREHRGISKIRNRKNGNGVAQER